MCHPQAEVDRWEARRQQLKRQYLARGFSDIDADEQATADVRHEIISSVGYDD